jgi:serine/threonine-protein kinase
MEHLEGETLAQRLRRGPVPLAQALDVAAQIAEALDAAQRALALDPRDGRAYSDLGYVALYVDWDFAVSPG